MKNKILILGLLTVFTFSFSLTSHAQQKRPVKAKIGIVKVKKPHKNYKKAEKQIESKPVKRRKIHSKYTLGKKAVQTKQRFRKPVRYKK